MESKITDLASGLGKTLAEKNLRITTVESCTGGAIAAAITRVAGSSAWFDMGFVTYSNGAKMKLVGVPQDVLSNYGAVSEQTVEAMALGALESSEANLAIATSGIAGPGGGTETKPVGLVWFAWALHDGREIRVSTESLVFSGNRQDIQQQAVAHALTIAHQKVLDYCM